MITARLWNFGNEEIGKKLESQNNIFTTLLELGIGRGSFSAFAAYVAKNAIYSFYALPKTMPKCTRTTAFSL